MCNVINTHLLIFAMIYKNAMRKLIYILSFCFLLTNCNDGDIITFELGFEDVEEFSECGELVFYKIKEDPFESLSLKLTSPIDNIEDLLEVNDNDSLVTSYSIDGSSNTFNYRSYGEEHSSTLAEELFCEDVPPSVTITNDSESEDGDVEVTTVLTEDDNDGIPAELEDLNNNGDLEDDDTDQDGLPNYLDDDDDGDNVPTESENPNYSVENGLNEAQDYDDDGTPDYLDTDDDDDGVLTIDEEYDSQDQDPRNDIYDNTVDADYLNPDVNFAVPATAYRQHSILQTYTITVVVTDFELPPLTQSYFDFGTLSPSETQNRYVTPDFN